MRQRMLMTTVFQFHKGTIRTRVRASGTLQVRHFNSIKVQLEQRMYLTKGTQTLISIP